MVITHYKKLSRDFFQPKFIEPDPAIRRIVEDVRRNGDEAIRFWTEKFDRVRLKELRVSQEKIIAGAERIEKRVISVIEQASENIRKFSRAQMEQLKDFEIEIVPGVITGQRIIPIERLGIYCPAGRYPLISTLMMCAVPARVAGVKEIIVCSPPGADGEVHPLILAGAKLFNVDEVYRIGGAQAISAMAFGSHTVRPVDKIVGPGNYYVAQAKRFVYGQVGIDFFAGPSEIMIIADCNAEPQIVAADLIAQAEHDPEALGILVTDSLKFAQVVEEEIEQQLKELKMPDVARQALKNKGLIIVVDQIEEAVRIANLRAPEHLELQVKNPEKIVPALNNYGSLFIGPYSAEVLGDYCAGPNHTLPTNTTARYCGGLGVKDFIKVQTILKVTKTGFLNIGPLARDFSELEGMDGHSKAIAKRKNDGG